MDLEECPTCNRKFREEAYEKHVKVCKDVFVKKRKAFNSKQKRILNKEHEQLLKQNNAKER